MAADDAPNWLLMIKAGEFPATTTPYRMDKILTLDWFGNSSGILFVEQMESTELIQI